MPPTIMPHGQLWRVLYSGTAYGEHDLGRVITTFSSPEFPSTRLTRHGWLIGSYDDLRALVRSLKADEAVRQRLHQELERVNTELIPCPSDKQPNGVVLLRYGRRETDKVYHDQGAALTTFSQKTGSRGAPKIHKRLSSEQVKQAAEAQGTRFTRLRTPDAHPSALDKRLPARVTDLDRHGDEYRAHWSARQFEAHHIVEDSLAAVRDKKHRTDLTRGTAPCVLLAADLHQRFITSAFAKKGLLDSDSSVRNLLNSKKTKEEFQKVYNQLYADPDFADLRLLAGAIIHWLFS